MLFKDEALIAWNVYKPKKIFTNGCFDLLHIGHIQLLQYAASLGELTVGLNSDRSVRLLKGGSRPINTQEDRKLILEALSCVYRVIIFDEETPYNLIRKIMPDMIVKGGDYKKEDVVGSDICQIEIFNTIKGYSSTKLIEKIKL